MSFILVYLQASTTDRGSPVNQDKVSGNSLKFHILLGIDLLNTLCSVL